jgi:hypothetical protein
MTPYFSLLRKFFALLCISIASSIAQASPIFSNFGAGYSYNANAGHFLGDGSFGGISNYAQASAFTASSNAALGTIIIALSDVFDAGQPASVTVALQADSGHNTPGNLLESFAIAAHALGGLGNANPALTLSSLTHPLLSSGMQYWVSASTSLANILAWNFNSTNDLTNNVETLSLDGGLTWLTPFGNTRGAFEVNPYTPTTTISEPSPALLLLGGILSMAGARCRRMNAL